MMNRRLVFVGVITSPAPNAPIAGASVPITVLANGSVTSVQLQVGRPKPRKPGNGVSDRCWGRR